jgi:hypothetical protein
LPLIEAMACGTPVIASDLPVLREVAGDAVLTFDPREPAAVARAMRAQLVLEQRARRRGYLESPAAVLEPVEVQCEPADLAVVDGHRLEQAVAEGEPAVGGIDAGWLSVHEPKSLHGFTARRLPSSSCSRSDRNRHVETASAVVSANV